MHCYGNPCLLHHFLRECHFYLCPLFQDHKGDQGLDVLGAKNCLSATLSTENPTRNALELKPGLRLGTAASVHVPTLLRQDLKRLYTAMAHIKLLKPTGHVMHQQFIIQQLYALPTLYLCFVFI